MGTHFAKLGNSVPHDTRNMITRAIPFTLLLVGLVTTVQAQDVSTEIRSFLQQRDSDIKAAIAQMEKDPTREEHVRKLVNEGIDFGEMGSRALGEHNAGLTTEQRTRYIDTFGAIVRAQSLSDLTVYNAQVSFGKINVNGNIAHVHTQAEVDGKKLPVEYLLHNKDGAWWVYDIILDGVGTIEGYAVSFQSVIRKHGFERLMTSLEKKRARVASAE